MLPAHYKYRPSFGLPHVSPCRKQVAALTGMRRLQTLNLQRSCCAAEGIARHDRLTTSSSRNPGRRPVGGVYRTVSRVAR
jgi:hypothetical protein